MQTDDIIAAVAAPTGRIGSSFYFHPATVGAGEELGLGGLRFYVLGRGGALGDVTWPVVQSSFGYFNPSLIERLWTSARDKVAPLTCAQLYFNECAARGRTFFVDVDESVLTAYADAADVVIGATSRSGLPLFAGTADLMTADDAAGRALQKAAVLRELRGSVHLCAVIASGLTDVQAHRYKRPEMMKAFGWETAPKLPDDIAERMDAVEQATNGALVEPYSALDDAGAAALLAGTEAMTAALDALPNPTGS